MIENGKKLIHSRMEEEERKEKEERRGKRFSCTMYLFLLKIHELPAFCVNIYDGILFSFVSRIFV